MSNNNTDVPPDNDTTQYPEFVPSFFLWTSFENQRRRAKELDKISRGIK